MIFICDGRKTKGDKWWRRTCSFPCDLEAWKYVPKSPYFTDQIIVQTSWPFYSSELICLKCMPMGPYLRHKIKGMISIYICECFLIMTGMKMWNGQAGSQCKIYGKHEIAIVNEKNYTTSLSWARTGFSCNWYLKKPILKFHLF